MKECFYCHDTGYIHTNDGIPDQMCPNCEIGQATYRGFCAAREIGIQANEKCEAENKRLSDALIKYSQHHRNCPNYGIGSKKCTCGFEQALEGE